MFSYLLLYCYICLEPNRIAIPTKDPGLLGEVSSVGFGVTYQRLRWKRNMHTPPSFRLNLCFDSIRGWLSISLQMSSRTLISEIYLIKIYNIWSVQAFTRATLGSSLITELSFLEWRGHLRDEP